MNIVMVGSLPPPIGGISVSFHILVEELQRCSDISIQVIDVSRIRRQSCCLVVGFITLVRAILTKVKSSDVITLSCASTALPSLGLLLLFLAKCYSKPLIIRKAAGLDYVAIGRVRGAVAHFVVKRADLYLAQTKFLVSLARQRGLDHVAWFPTHRPLAEKAREPWTGGHRCRRFVFIGQVREHKGVREILAAAARFEQEIQVDIYGPVFEDVATDLAGERLHVHYGGVLPPDQVTAVLQQHDLFLLPSKHAPEGYPGAIVEALAAGLPVITTRLGGIPEIVDERCGLFVEPGDANSLYEAMKKVVEDQEYYQQLLQGVELKRREFDSAVWAGRFIEHCRRAAALQSISGRSSERSAL